MTTPALPTKLIICVDGTWCTPDGPYGSSQTNISNVYRVCASVKIGECVDSNGQKFKQQKLYYQGVGSKDNIPLAERVHQGIFGNESIKQIREVYEKCCMLPGHPKDEIWLFGFSRGAYVVRAVAGLLHYLRALSSAGSPQFQSDYDQALKVYRSMQKSSRLGPGQIHEYFAASTREPPKIQFVGIFDTVKFVDDKGLYDISFNDSIQHLRHTLALNEDRKAMTPEYLFPEFHTNQLLRRSFVQAWFLGAHIDLGGSATKDGLSLYPLQWMLLESRSKGLVLEFDGSFQRRVSIDNPLNVVFPRHESHGKSLDLCTLKLKNGLAVQMQDIRKVHQLQRYNHRYGIRLNRHHSIYWQRQQRRPFTNDGLLQGYCGYAPQGTIIHPSVYLIFDEYCHVFLNSKDLAYRSHMEKWRSHVVGSKSEFWNDREVLSIEEPAAIRILVCGNNGVGKSTLINEVFGVKVTESSNRKRGMHNIKEPLTAPGRPDLIIHDSCGFEAGGEAEIEDVKKFVSEQSTMTEIKDRLHVVWMCLELNSSRTQQVASRKLYKAVSQHAKDVPIIVVATKKDEFLGAKAMDARRIIEVENKSVAEYLAALDQYAETQLHERMELIERELLEIEGGRFDAVVSVSKDDKETIRHLTEVTAHCFDHEKVRLLYIASQVTRIDLKIDLAIAETMHIYKHTVRNTAAASIVPGGASTHRVAVAALVCQAIVACFGVPGVSPKTIQSIVKSVIWEDMGNSIPLIFVEAVAGVGLFGTLILGGMPVFLAAGLVNAPIAIPATTRLILMLATDVILILTKAFKKSTEKCIGQPLKKDIEDAAFEYRNISEAVHGKINKVVPMHNFVKSLQVNKVKRKFEKIVDEYKMVSTDIGQSARVKDLSDGESDSEASDSESTVINVNEKI